MKTDDEHNNLNPSDNTSISLQEKTDKILTELNMLRKKAPKEDEPIPFDNHFCSDNLTIDEKLSYFLDNINKINSQLKTHFDKHRNTSFDELMFLRKEVRPLKLDNSNKPSRAKLYYTSFYEGIPHEKKRTILEETTKNSEIRQNLYSAIFEMMKDDITLGSNDNGVNFNNDIKSSYTNFSIRDSPPRESQRDKKLNDIENIVNRLFNELDMAIFDKKFLDLDFIEFENSVMLNLRNKAYLRKLCNEYISNNFSKEFIFPDREIQIKQFVDEIGNTAAVSHKLVINNFCYIISKNYIFFKLLKKSLHFIQELFIQFIKKLYNNELSDIEIDEFIKPLMYSIDEESFYIEIKNLINKLKQKSEENFNNLIQIEKDIKEFIYACFTQCSEYRIKQGDENRLKRIQQSPKKAKISDPIISLSTKKKIIKRNANFDMPLKIKDSLNIKPKPEPENSKHFINSYSPLKEIQIDETAIPKKAFKINKIEIHKFIDQPETEFKPTSVESRNYNLEEKILISETNCIEPTIESKGGRLITFDNHSNLAYSDNDENNNNNNNEDDVISLTCDVEYESVYVNRAAQNKTRTLGDIRTRKIIHNKITSEKLNQKYLTSFIEGDSFDQEIPANLIVSI
jgi:hypothetical protein